jgi:hypothetical protein
MSELVHEPLFAENLLLKDQTYPALDFIRAR